MKTIAILAMLLISTAAGQIIMNETAQMQDCVLIPSYYICQNNQTEPTIEEDYPLRSDKYWDGHSYPNNNKEKKTFVYILLSLVLLAGGGVGYVWYKEKE